MEACCVYCFGNWVFYTVKGFEWHGLIFCYGLKVTLVSCKGRALVDVFMVILDDVKLNTWVSEFWLNHVFHKKKCWDWFFNFLDISLWFVALSLLFRTNCELRGLIWEDLLIFQWKSVHMSENNHLQVVSLVTAWERENLWPF